MIDVFVSRPTCLPDEFSRGLDRFFAFLDSHDLRPRTVGVTDYPAAAPLDEVIRLMGRCRGAIILGFPQIEVHTGALKGRPLENPITLPTEWNHIEAGLAYASGLPLLVIHHPGVVRGVFDRGAINRFIHEVDLRAPDWPLRPNISGAIKTWKAEMLEADVNADRRIVNAGHRSGGVRARAIRDPGDVDAAVRLLAPDYRVPTLDDLLGDWFESYNEETGFPIVCTGGFTGRAQGECAIFLLGRREARYRVVVFSEDRSGTPILIELESGDGYPRNRFLRTLGPGPQPVSRIIWKDGGPRTLHLRRDAIELGTFESATCAYYWDEETESFAQQWLSD